MTGNAYISLKVYLSLLWTPNVGLLFRVLSANSVTWSICALSVPVLTEKTTYSSCLPLHYSNVIVAILCWNPLMYVMLRIKRQNEERKSLSSKFFFRFHVTRCWMLWIYLYGYDLQIFWQPQKVSLNDYFRNFIFLPDENLRNNCKYFCNWQNLKNSI